MADVAAQRFDAETAVIGCILIAPDLLPQLLTRADERDFQSKPARLAFQAARSLLRDGKQVDAFSMRNLLGAEYSDYLAQCIELTPSAAAWQEYAAALHEQAALARIKAEAVALAGAQTLDDCRASVERLGAEFGAGRRVESWAIGELLDEFAQRTSSDVKPDYVSYGLAPLDAGTFTLRGDVVMIGGDPSAGKTAFAVCTAYHMAKRYNVGFFSLETSREKLTDRLVASGFDIDLTAIKRHTMNEADWTRFATGLPDAAGRRLRIFRGAGMTAEQIAATARAYQLDVVFIDYVQLVETPEGSRRENRATQMAEVSRTLHTFAQSTGTLVVELAQLTRQEPAPQRAPKKGEPPPPDKERTMFDLAESAQFGRDADLILLICRPGNNTHLDADDPTSPLLDKQKHRVLLVAKNKEFVGGRWPLAFDGAHQRFTVLHDDRAVMRKYVAIGKEVKERNHREAMKAQGYEEVEDENAPF